MDHQSLPGIKFIGYVPAENLQREIMYKHLAGLPVGIFTEVTPIAFVGVPTCEAVSTYNNNGRVEQATLRFRAARETAPDHQNHERHRNAWRRSCGMLGGGDALCPEIFNSLHPIISIDNSFIVRKI